MYAMPIACRSQELALDRLQAQAMNPFPYLEEPDDTDHDEIAADLDTRAADDADAHRKDRS
jgi:hypothetical protein